MNKVTVPIKGMHCRSCEILIEDELTKIPGVQKTYVSHKHGTAEIFCKEQINEAEIGKAVTNAGYEIGIDEKKPFFSKNPQDYYDVAASVIIMATIFLIIEKLGLSSFFTQTGSNPTSLIAVLLIGLTAGFSTCMALVGGLVLGASARFSEKHPFATTHERFKPQIFFNLGRIASYTILGGVIGFLGSFFQISGIGLGLLTLIASLIMLMLGIQLSGLFPRIAKAQLTLPKGIAKALGIKEHNQKEYTHKNSALLGALTFFLPCGFTQSMQVLAISSGSFLTGSLIMGTFALGTAPGLLGIGGLTSVVKGAFAQKFFKFSGVVVVFMALFNLNNSLNLIGYNPLNSFLGDQNVQASSDSNNVQVVRMDQSRNGYTPSSFTVKKGIPVKWIVNSLDQNTCARSLYSAQLGIRKILDPGENTFEFTPQEAGQIRFSCSMGMYTGVFNVVDNNNSQPQAFAATPVPNAESVNSCSQKPVSTKASCSSTGGGCGCGGGGNVQAQAPGPIQQAINQGETQVIKTTYTRASDISPKQFQVKANQKVRMEIDVKDNGSGCMATIMVPRLTDNPQFLKQGSTIVFQFTPTQTGDYPITCAMGVPRGVIKVI